METMLGNIQSLYNQNKREVELLRSQNADWKEKYDIMRKRTARCLKKCNEQKIEINHRQKEMGKLRNEMRELRSKEMKLTQKLNLYNGESEVINTLSIK